MMCLPCIAYCISPLLPLPLWLQPSSRPAVWPRQWGTGCGTADQPGEPSHWTPRWTQHPPVYNGVHTHEEVVHSEHVGGVSCRGDTTHHGVDGMHGRHPQWCVGHGGHVVCLAVSPFQFLKLERAWWLQKGRVQDDGTLPPWPVQAGCTAVQHGHGAHLRSSTSVWPHNVVVCIGHTSRQCIPCVLVVAVLQGRKLQDSTQTISLHATPPSAHYGFPADQQEIMGWSDTIPKHKLNRKHLVLSVITHMASHL